MDTEKKLGPVELVRVDLPELLLGLGLVVLGLWMPAILNVRNFGILETMYHALVTFEKIDLMLAALKLVILNSLRGIPHYVGVFFMAESLEFRYKGRNFLLANACLILVALQATYWGIEALHHVHYDFGIPAIGVSAMVLLFEQMNYRYVGLQKKFMIIAVGLTALQFLDVMPAVKALPIGRGEISRDIKLAAMLMGGEAALDAMAAVGCVLFLLFGILLAAQVREENNLRELAALREQNQAVKLEAHINEMKNRTYQEMQALVHDLKSPLAAVQTLVGVIKMECEMEQRSEDLEYLTRIEEAVDQMSRMISEILYEERTTPETVKWLVGRVLAQISVEPYAPYLKTEILVPDAKVRVNRVTFPRALVNLIQNSARAIPEGRIPRILLRVDAADGAIRFRVEDNGCGIAQDKLQSVWERGYSGTQSSGLGLPFVRNVVERMGGHIETKSTLGQGTAVILSLLEEGKEDEP